MSPEQVITRCYGLLGEGREEEALPLLEEQLARHPGRADLHQALGLCLRAAERLGEAAAAFKRAAALAPRDIRIAHGLAQCRAEAGLPAVEAFEAARTLAPADLAIAQGWVAAIAVENGPEEALEPLKALLSRFPEWMPGHWLASRLTAAAGRDEPADASVCEAIARHPGAVHLWQHRLSTLLHAKKWEQARAAAANARVRFPEHVGFAWDEAAAASEDGDLRAAEAIYRQLGPIPDMSNAIFLCRHWLRTGRPEAIAALASAPAAAELYPYLVLAWRLLRDARADWLEPAGMVRIYDLADRLPPLGEVTEYLRTLHTQAPQPLEQSVRNGTQTLDHLLLRDEPVIRQLRAVLVEAVSQHLRDLPSEDSRHPQLRQRRDRPIRFAGSWSVRLTGGGYHEQHVHPQGWFSSALYLSLPEATQMRDKAGWLVLGEPQDRLGLDLGPEQLIEPKPGRLVLFPSTMWHGTRPFQEGERLTVAFDVKVPN